MPIITISRGSYSHGKKVAESVAGKLGYECVSREAILESSHQFITPAMESFKAAHNGHSSTDTYAYAKEKYRAYVRKMLIECFHKDNVVYHGFEGQFFVQGISHVLKVRVIADMDIRIAEEMSRKGITALQARKSLEKDDAAHHRWSHYIYGRDNADPSLYDMVIPLHAMDVDDAAEIICRAVKRPCFSPTSTSQSAMRMLWLAARVQVSLMEDIPFVKVDVEDKELVVTIKGNWTDGKKMMTRISQMMNEEKEFVGIKVRLIGH